MIGPTLRGLSPPTMNALFAQSARIQAILFEWSDYLEKQTKLPSVG